MNKKFDLLALNKESIALDLKDLDNNKPKGKLPILSIVFLVIAFGLIPGYFIPYNYFLLFILGSLISLTVAFFSFSKVHNQNKIAYAKYIEQKHLEYAKENDILSLNSIHPVFLKIDDDSRSFKIKYRNEDILEASFEDFKNYRIYLTDKKHEAKQRLKEIPDKVCKTYIFEINFNDEQSFTITFDNNIPKFVINNKWFYQQYSNIKTINGLAIVIDKILDVKKKSK